VIGSLTIALLTNYLQSRATFHLTALGRGVASTYNSVSGAVSHVPAPVLDAIAKAYQDTFTLTALVMLPAFVAAWFMRPLAGTTEPARKTSGLSTPDPGAAQTQATT
jgi:hypothetical protein